MGGAISRISPFEDVFASLRGSDKYSAYEPPIWFEDMSGRRGSGYRRGSGRHQVDRKSTKAIRKSTEAGGISRDSSPRVAHMASHTSSSTVDFSVNTAAKSLARYQRLLDMPGPDSLHYKLLRDIFNEDVHLTSVVQEWEAGRSATLFLDAAEEGVADGVLPSSLPPALRGKPIFQALLEQVECGDKALSQAFPSVIYGDAQCVAFTPAGFRGDVNRNAAAVDAIRHKHKKLNVAAAMQELTESLCLTPLTMNPVSSNQGKCAALMSHAHVLVIPRERKYNAVTLTSADVPLIRHLQLVGKACVRALLRADGRDEHGLASALGQVPQTLAELAAAPYLPGGLSLGEECARQIGGSGSISEPETTFHVYPQASIGWLHLHASCAKLRTAAHAKSDLKARGKVVGERDGFPKNIRADDIVSVLLSAPAPPGVKPEPVGVWDVLRAIRAASIMQKEARRYLRRRRKLEGRPTESQE